MVPEIMTGDSYLPLWQGQHQDRFVLVEGRRGTGKTRAILTYLVAQAIRYPGSRWMLARSTRTLLSATVLQTLYRQVLPLFGIPRPAASPSQVDVIPVHGSFLVPMGMDTISRNQSAEFSGGYVAEATEIALQDDVTSLTGAMREASGVPYHQIIVDCNPGAPGHWLNKVAEPAGNELRVIETQADYRRTLRHNRRQVAEGGPWKRIITHTADNPYYWDAPAWQPTKAGAEYLAGLKQLTGHLRDRWLYGLWTAAEGNVYAEFSEQQHVIEPFDVPADWPWWVMFDPGKDHPCGVSWITRGPAGCLYIADEMYGSGHEIRDVVKHIEERRPGRSVVRLMGDPQMVASNTMYAEKSIAAQFRDFGLTLATWPRTGRNSAAMVEAVRTLLTTKPEPMLKVFRSCPNHIMEFQSWRYKRTAAGELPPGDDQFEDKDNHLMDCVRGGIAAGIARVGVSVRAIDGEAEPSPGVRQIAGSE